MERHLTLQAVAETRSLKDTAALRRHLYEYSGLCLIDTTLLGDLDHQNGTATDVILIGEADCRGKEYRTETTRVCGDGRKAMGCAVRELPRE